MRYDKNPIMQSMYLDPENKGRPMYESAGTEEGKDDKGGKDDKKPDELMLEAVGSRALADIRALAASMLATWVSDGEPDADSFDALAMSVAGLDDMDEDEDPTDEQVDAYNDALSALADAAVALGADQDDVSDMIDDYDDAAALRVMKRLKAQTRTCWKRRLLITP